MQTRLAIFSQTSSRETKHRWQTGIRKHSRCVHDLVRLNKVHYHSDSPMLICLSLLIRSHKQGMGIVMKFSTWWSLHVLKFKAVPSSLFQSLVIGDRWWYRWLVERRWRSHDYCWVFLFLISLSTSSSLQFHSKDTFIATVSRSIISQVGIAFLVAEDCVN